MQKIFLFTINTLLKGDIILNFSLVTRPYHLSQGLPKVGKVVLLGALTDTQGAMNSKGAMRS